MNTEIVKLAKEVRSAIAEETAAYRSAPAVGPSNKDADRVTFRVAAAEKALLSVPADNVEAHMLATGDMDYIHALALLQRRWLVMGGGYQQQVHAAECRLVDTLLSLNDTFGDVPMLWHMDGEPRTDRPSDAELRAGWSE